MEPPFLGGRYLSCPSCKRRFRRGPRALSRYRQHWMRRHQARQSHPDIIPWLGDEDRLA